MLRFLLLIAGASLLLINHHYPITQPVQVLIFLIGLIILGIPHGGADQLIASKNIRLSNNLFSKTRFNFNYCGHILLFALFYYLFPLFGVVLFLSMAAYHFGETDLQKLKKQSLPTKILVFNYGILILSLIILPDFPHFESFLKSLNPGNTALAVIHWIANHNLEILIFDAALFGTMAVAYFIFYERLLLDNLIELINLMILMVILYYLPLTLSFTFYFIFWHSIFSIENIIQYLVQDKLLNMNVIIRDLIKNSLIALLGLFLVGIASSRLIDADGLVLYSIFGLAILTAPHMRVMHEMYIQLADERAS